jgi:hypothetical protein
MRSPSRAKTLLIGLGAALGTLGVIVALVNDSFSLADRFGAMPTAKSSSQPSLPASPTAIGSPSASQGLSHTPLPSAAERCGSARGELVDCQLPHRYETYVGSCDTGGVVAWLGGRADVDVVRATVVASDRSCLVDLKTEAVGSASQAFKRGASPAFRRCWDEQSGSLVTCDEPHTHEYIAAAVERIATADQCAEAARTYLEVGIDQRSDELRVSALTEVPAVGDNARCVIEVVGAERLEQSVRAIRNTQLRWVD